MSKQPTKIEQIGEDAEILVYQGRAEGKGYRRIAEDLEQQFGESVSHMAVKNYIETRFDKRLAELGKENLQEIRKNEFEKVLNVSTELEELYGKLKNALDNLDENDRTDMGQLVNLAREMRQYLQFHREFVEEITTPNTQINNVEINKNDIAVKVVNKVKELEEADAIEIKDPEKLKEIV